MDCHGPGTKLLVCIYLLIYVWINVWLTYTFGYSHVTGFLLDIGNQLGPNLHLTYGGKSDVSRYLPNLRDASDHFLSDLLLTFLELPLSLASHLPHVLPLLPLTQTRTFSLHHFSRTRLHSTLVYTANCALCWEQRTASQQSKRLETECWAFPTSEGSLATPAD